MFEILLPLNYVSNLNQEEFSSLTTQNAVSDLYSAYSKDYDNTYIYLSQVFILMYRCTEFKLITKMRSAFLFSKTTAELHKHDGLAHAQFEVHYLLTTVR